MIEKTINYTTIHYCILKDNDIMKYLHYESLLTNSKLISGIINTSLLTCLHTYIVHV